MKVECVQETTREITLRITKPNTHYLNEIFRLKCAPDLLSTGYFPNPKEWTESAAAFHAVLRTVGHKTLGESSVLLLDVGSGHKPRTAAMFALRSRWCCNAVDPFLKCVGPLRIERLHGVAKKIEDVQASDLLIPPSIIAAAGVHTPEGVRGVVKQIDSPSVAVAVGVHAHVTPHAMFEAVVRCCPGVLRVVLVHIPCCGFERESTRAAWRPWTSSYEDHGIWSPFRSVRIWDIHREHRL